ncbi:MAG: tetratricopeptide repeat protein [Bacteroidota bacterium]
MIGIHKFLLFSCIVCSFVLLSPAQDTKENADFKLALNLFNDQLFDLAVDQFRNFVTAYPNTEQGIEARYYIGAALLKLKRYEEARTQFQNFSISYPQHPKAADAWWQVGESYAALGNAAEAASAFERLKVFYPTSKLAPDALLRASDFFQRASDMENAKKVLRALIQEYTTNQSVLIARLRLGSLFAKEGNTEQARAEFRRVLDGSIPGLKAEALVSLGNLNASIGKIEEAEKNLREALSLYGKSSIAPAAALALGTLYRQQGNLTAASDLLKKVANDTTNVDTTLQQNALLQYGTTAYQLHDIRTALSSYDTFIRRFPVSPLLPQALFSAGKASEQNNDLQKSQGYFKQIVQRFPASPETRLALVYCTQNASMQKHYREAITFARHFISAYPDDGGVPRMLLTAAEIAEKNLNDPPLALELYHDITVTYSNSEYADEAFFGIARCTESTSTTEKAIAAYQDILQQYPATDFAEIIEHRIDSLQTYVLKNRDGGLDKLARIMADVIAQQSRADLSYKLAEIYFNDLKDYRSAASQYTNAIAQGLSDTTQQQTAAAARARSLRLLSAVDEHATDDALKAYDEFLQRYPSSSLAPEATLERSLMREGLLTGADELIARLSSPEKRAFYAIQIAERAMTAQNYDSALHLLQPFGTTNQEALYLSAHALELSGRKDSAVVLYAQYSELYSNHRHTADALIRRAQHSLDEGKTTDVISLCDRILSQFSYTLYAQQAELLKAEAAARAAHYDDAITLYNALLNKQKENAFTSETPRPDIIIALASLYAKLNNAMHAKELYREYLTLDNTAPPAVDALTALGNYARSEGNIELATSFFKRASELNAAAGTRRQMADLLFQSGNYADAIIQYSTIEQQSNSDEEIKYCESRIIIAQFRSNAITDAERRTEQFKKNYKNEYELIAEFTLERGTHYYRKQEYQKSKKAFDEILDDYDETASAPAALYWNGRIAETQNRTDEAVKILENVMERYPTAPILSRTRLALGNIYFRKEQYEKSIGYYRVIVDSSTDAEILPLALNNIIVAYKEVGVYDAALQLTRKFISLYPNDESITDKRVDIGILYEKLGYYDQAIIQFQHLLDEADSDLEAEIRYYLGECYFYQTQYQEAILEFLKVPYLVTKKTKIDWTANAFYMSGQSYEKMSKYKQAIGMYQQIIDRPGLDATFKAAAEKEIRRVKNLVQQEGKK